MKLLAQLDRSIQEWMQRDPEEKCGTYTNGEITGFMVAARDQLFTAWAREQNKRNY